LRTACTAAQTSRALRRALRRALWGAVHARQRRRRWWRADATTVHTSNTPRSVAGRALRARWCGRTHRAARPDGLLKRGGAVRCTAQRGRTGVECATVRSNAPRSAASRARQCEREQRPGGGASSGRSFVKLDTVRCTAPLHPESRRRRRRCTIRRRTTLHLVMTRYLGFRWCIDVSYARALLRWHG
jgi:hypothetical protein